MKLRKGDSVIVRSGKDKGKKGTISAVLPDLNMVVVDGINIVKRARKPSAKYPKGGILEEARPVPVSKVGIVHPSKSMQTSRIGFVIKNGQKLRVYRQAGNKEIK